MPFHPNLKKYAEIVAALTIWLPVVVFGFTALRDYSTTPGNPGSPPDHWPERAPITQEKGQPAILMFLHPQCACSRATVNELENVMAQSKGRAKARVYFYLPENEAVSWAASDLWQTANRIPGVQTFVDRSAAMARVFGASTSGQTLVYGANGQLLFRGGITPFRGHSGDNAGRAAVTEMLAIDTGAVSSAIARPVVSPVLGCSLLGER